MRAIFVPVAARPECEVALETTFAMAQRLGSDVIGCHIRPAPTEPGDWDMADLWTMSRSSQSWPVGDEREQERAAQSAKDLFSAVAGRFGFDISDEPGTPERPRAHWQTRSGSPPDLMPTIGAASDMLVVSRPPERGGQKAWLVMTAALLDSRRPVLVLPQQKTNASGRRLAIAWNRGRMETLVVHSALPLIKAADDVVFLTAGSERRHGPESDDMIRFLSFHGVTARAKHVDRSDAASALVDTAAAEGADLLLAGAYTRGRFRELLFGGVTEHLVTKTTFPVLMMHVG
jgi:nucleotide-binding universal stress UspA family protein